MPLVAQAVRLSSSHVLVVWATHCYIRLHDFDMIWRDIHTDTHVLPSVRHLVMTSMSNRLLLIKKPFYKSSLSKAIYKPFQKQPYCS